ncbi:hypothetical protein H6F67_05990 [Microcoleus sp. FACHB-1515]|uniref:hypothetical protein n=1 Tax=Cyanophyceae TaxID=3028117 RepID=UPI001687D66B|nr:hypothetical protein [Microcoleus sp. FACHB-1515]MBD2089400.1 hypothetical protein [Microcoleus sp. FACHB-1515]
MKFASWVLASTVLLSAIAPSAHAQTANQYQHQLNRAVCLNNWTEALSFVRLLIGSEQTTPQQRQQLVTFRNQLENYRASNAVFDHSGDPNCAAAIAAAPREAAALQAISPPPRRPVQSAVVNRPAASAAVAQPAANPSIAATPSFIANRPVRVDPSLIVFVRSYCQARRNGVIHDIALPEGVRAYQEDLVSRYGAARAQEFRQAVGSTRWNQELAGALLDECPEVFD